MAPRSDREFSRRGEAPTAYETALLAEAASSPGIDDVWVLIATRIGANALAVVLDEIGGEKPHVPTRDAFFAELARRKRNERIVELLGSGKSRQEVARLFGITAETVRKVIVATRHPDAACAGL